MWCVAVASRRAEFCQLFVGVPDVESAVARAGELGATVAALSALQWDRNTSIVGGSFKT